MFLSPETAAESGFARTLLNGDFAVTAELVPPASGAPDELLALAEPFRGLVDALNVTDGPRAMVHMSGLAAAALLVREGIEPILQFACRDRNRIALQSDLLGASAVGVRNVLILRGDDPDTNEIPPPKPVFDVDSRDLIQIAAKMRAGEALASGREIGTAPRLFIGAADTPVDPEPGWRPTGLARKIEAGAGFVQTQLCWDIDVVRRYAGGAGGGGADRPRVPADRARPDRLGAVGTVDARQSVGRPDSRCDRRTPRPRRRPEGGRHRDLRRADPRPRRGAGRLRRPPDGPRRPVLDPRGDPGVGRAGESRRAV